MPEMPINKGDFSGLLQENFPWFREMEGDEEYPHFRESGLFYQSQEFAYKLPLEFPKIIEQNRIGKSHPLNKCFPKPPARIVDLTCGEGRDALQLLLMGYQVRAYERVPLIAGFFLINLYLLSQKMDLPLEHFEYIIGDWKDDKSLIADDHLFYYDPMFIPEKRKALPRGTIQLFESLGNDQDQTDRATWLYHNIKGRLVIKRQPRIAPIIPKKTFEINSKLVRFDVYERS